MPRHRAKIPLRGAAASPPRPQLPPPGWRLPLLQLLLLLLFLPPRCLLAWRRPLRDSDLVLVRGTCSGRLELAHATGRAARANNSTSLRAVYVLEDPALATELQQRFGGSSGLNETYLAWPDRPDPLKPGDTRVALAPWLAHRALGESYKWMLYGDDDTFFFVDNVKTLLRDYDPELPYVVSDALWHKRSRNLMEAPRCLPCHLSTAYRRAVAERPDTDPPSAALDSKSGPLRPAPMPPPGCPCTPQLACEYTLNVTGKREEALQRTRPLAWSPESKHWGFPRNYPTVCDYPHFHGGSGVLISLGAMRKVPYAAALRCFYDNARKRTARPESLKAMAHGDRMTSLCFWLHGLAITDPGLSLSRHETTYPGGRVMDARTANAGSLERGINGSLQTSSWLWSILTMQASHVGHHPGAVQLTWQLAELFPQARRAAIRGLRAQGLWGRGELDAQTVQQGLTWVKGAWVFERQAGEQAGADGLEAEEEEEEDEGGQRDLGTEAGEGITLPPPPAAAAAAAAARGPAGAPAGGAEKGPLVAEAAVLGAGQRPAAGGGGGSSSPGGVG